MSYYNTTKEKGKDLKKFKEKAKTQDQRILELFKNRTIFQSKKMSASMIHRSTGILLTSVRRSLNTLENKGKIKRIDVKVQGQYGRKEYLYKLYK